MSTVTVIPTLPQGSEIKVSYKSNALDLTPTTGGPTTRIAQLGDRFTVETNLRGMSNPQAQQLNGYLRQGMSGKVRLPLIEYGMEIGSPGTPVANGAGQAGTTLSVTGFTPGYFIEPGKFFNVVSNGVHYLHQVTLTATADGSGNAAVTFVPMLRVSPNNADTLVFDAPVIEGFLTSMTQTDSMDLTGTVTVSFGVAEAQ